MNSQDLVNSGLSENTTQSSQISNDKNTLFFSSRYTQDQLKQQLIEKDPETQMTDDKLVIQNHEQSSSAADKLGEKEEPALLFNKNVPLWFKVLLPTFLIATTVLFIFSNSGIGATVMTRAQIGSKSPADTIIKSFGLINTIVDMWKAGVYPLSILIAAFSGIWPYAKIFLLTMCLILNQKQLSFKNRERILVILDTMGKWSMIDAYVLILMFVAFYINQENVLAMPFSFIVYADPGFGIYSFVAGTMGSLVYTHFVMHYHRKQRAKIIPPDADQKLHLGSKSAWRQNGVLLIMLLAVVLFLVGASVKTFQFRFRGAVTLVIDPESIEESYSMISLGTSMPDKTVDPNGAGIRFLQIMYFFFTLVIPLLFLMVLAALWAIPMKIKIQQKFFVFAEIMHAWSNVEVFIISVIVSLVEIRQFVQFIIGDKCNLIDNWLKVLDEYGVINLDGDTHCYDIKIELKEGCALLFSAAVLYFVLGTAILRYCQKNLTKRVSHYQYEPQVSFLRENDDDNLEVQSSSDNQQNSADHRLTVSVENSTSGYQNHQSRFQPSNQGYSNLSSELFQSDAENPLGIQGIQGVQQNSDNGPFNFNLKNTNLDHIKEAPLSFLERSDPV